MENSEFRDKAVNIFLAFTSNPSRIGEQANDCFSIVSKIYRT